jgi:prepilin-type N-terminal cleavage/methylation domain-containing protein
MKNIACKRCRSTGFTLVEILVSVVLLSVSLMAMMTLWSVSRKITERSRDGSEYYAVARREAEKTRRYRGVFLNSAYTSTNPATSGVSPATTTPYNQDAQAPTVAKPAVYQAISTFTRKQTGSEDAERQLGVQVIDVYLLPRTTGDVPIYSTSMFFSVGGV